MTLLQRTRPVTPVTFLALACFVVVASALLAGAAGCRGARVDAISRILNDPAAFAERDVTVAGRVTRVFDPSGGLLALSAYQVEDKTGKIWVLSRSGTPSVGREVGLKGRVRQDFRLGSEVFGAVLNEIQRGTR